MLVFCAEENIEALADALFNVRDNHSYAEFEKWTIFGA